MALATETVLYLTDHDLEVLDEEQLEQYKQLRQLDVSQNLLTQVPDWLTKFPFLQVLEVSNNRLAQLPEALCKVQTLVELHCRNNQLQASSFPKHFGELRQLRVLNLGGNLLEEIPLQFYDLAQLQELYLGGNQIFFLHADIERLSQLTLLYLGGNRIRALPPHLGNLPRIKCLNLSDNLLQALPSSLGRLADLQSLSLHGNELQALPPEILNLTQLEELSLRNNPLVDNFVRHIDWQVPSLKELAGRCVLVHRVGFNERTLPRPLIAYLETSRQCVNPKCRGVYFSHCVQRVEFVDFCGKYRLPLWRYLCNATCCEGNPRHRTDVSEEEASRLQQRVLLG